MLLTGAGIALFGIGIDTTPLQQANHATQPETRQNSGLQERTATIGNTTLQVELAETAQQQQTGLSHRESLKQGKGMLFIFNEDSSQPIWMKDMQFSIDIIWLNVAMKVVHIEQRVTPETYPQIFQSPTPARYVLEVPAGYTDGRITINDTLTLKERQE